MPESQLEAVLANSFYSSVASTSGEDGNVVIFHFAKSKHNGTTEGDTPAESILDVAIKPEDYFEFFMHVVLGAEKYRMQFGTDIIKGILNGGDDHADEPLQA
ncbi:MAG: hypothetical protein LBR72_06035 [Oscillospiraceae bacterium]|nr:hypothetical protein [Oscillospiraceae bacterium]